MDTPTDHLPRHALTYRLTRWQTLAGYTAACLVCGDLMENFEDADGVCCPQPQPNEKETR